MRSTVFDLLSAVPTKEMAIEDIIAYLHSHPNDKFMHKYLISRLGEFSKDGLDQLIEKAKKREDFLLLASLYQTCISYPKFYNLRKKFDDIDLQTLADYTPLIYIRWSLDGNLEARCFWMDVFAKNKYLHRKLPLLEDIEFPIPFDSSDLMENKNVVHIEDVYSGSEDKSFNTGTAMRRVEPRETIDRLLRNPTIQDLLLPDEVKLTCSISPYAFIRGWKMEIGVSVGRNNWKMKLTFTVKAPQQMVWLQGIL